jgi:ketosteroid isomerase-like protein
MNPNEELARREIEKIEAGDMDAVNAMYADDFVLHYPGRSPSLGRITMSTTSWRSRVVSWLAVR